MIFTFIIIVSNLRQNADTGSMNLVAEANKISSFSPIFIRSIYCLMLVGVCIL